MPEKEGFYLNNLEEDTEFRISRMFGGEIYIGGMSKGVYEGYGELFARKRRLEYKGFFKGGKPCGETVTLYNSKGKIEYQGGMEDGMKSGPGEWYHFNGKLKCKGDFLNDGPHGENIAIYFQNGKANYEGSMREGKKNGIGKLYSILGDLVYDGRWRNDRKEGYGTDYDKDGSKKCYGYFVRGYLSGLKNVKFYWPGCDVVEYEGGFVNGKKEGFGKEYFRNGKMKCLGFWKNNVLDIPAKSKNFVRILDESGNVRYDGFRVDILKSSDNADDRKLGGEIERWGI
jgi:antitoxin component YwqK of YwqJK toxin-antitoxin module